MQYGKVVAITTVLLLAAASPVLAQVLVAETAGKAEVDEPKVSSSTIVVSTTRPNITITKAALAGPFTIIHPGKDLRAFSIDRKMEKAAFLGVTASPVTPVLGKQLDLPKGVGLIVEHIAPDSPAIKAGLQKHDILYKINDQLLINTHQLAVLVRINKPGDEVVLTIIRQARKRTVKVKLIEKKLPELLPPPIMGSMPHMPPWHFGKIGPGRHAKMSSVCMSDDKHTLTLTVDKKGQRHLKATDKSGKVVFDGPVQTDEQRKALPKEIRGKLDKIRMLWKNRSGKSWSPGKDFREIRRGKGDFHSNSISMIDGDYSMTLIVKKGIRHFTVKDKSEKVIFDGPVQTAEQRKALTKEIRVKLEKVEAIEKKIGRMRMAPGR